MIDPMQPCLAPSLPTCPTHLEVAGAFEDHGGVGEHFGDEWHAFKNSILKKGVDCVVGEAIVGVSGHGWVSG